MLSVSQLRYITEIDNHCPCSQCDACERVVLAQFALDVQTLRDELITQTTNGHVVKRLDALLGDKS